MVIGGTANVVTPSFPGRAVAERVRPGREGERCRHQPEVDDSDDLQGGCGGDVTEQLTGKRQAGDRSDEAGKPSDLQGRDATQHDLLGHHGDRVDGGAEQHQENAGEVGLAGARGEADDQGARERDQAADDQHPRKALAEEDAGEYADEDRCELDEHRGGAGVDMLLAGIEGDAVDREPGNSDQRGERPLSVAHADELAADHHGAEGKAAYQQAAQAEGARADVVSRVPDDDKG